MELTIQPARLRGSIGAPSSKSMAHRYLIAAALSDRPTVIRCPDHGKDIEATCACLSALGAEITETDGGFLVDPIKNVPRTALLPCGESGSTLRFLLPVAAALGVDAEFSMEGSLPRRPIGPLAEVLTKKGCRISHPTDTTLRCSGSLPQGDYTITGAVSSQFPSGLLFALSIKGGSLTVAQPFVSKDYFSMTMAVLRQFGLEILGNGSKWQVSGNLHSPGTVTVEGDWSNGAFWLAASALGSRVTVTNLNPESLQGDHVIGILLSRLDARCRIDGRRIPDLIPLLAVVAGAKEGAEFTGVSRLREKESDRLLSIAALIRSLGGSAEVRQDTLRVEGTGYSGGTVDAFGDHRIAMAAAIASTVCQHPVTVRGAESVSKSYPRFWEDFSSLGGKYEQFLR